jgi:hypothetical protein
MYLGTQYASVNCEVLEVKGSMIWFLYTVKNSFQSVQFKISYSFRKIMDKANFFNTKIHPLFITKKR